jgi:hypothetical protein
MAEKKEDLSLVGYTLGIVSIIMSFISSYGLGGIVFGIVGLTLSKKHNTDLAKKAKKLNIVGIIVGLIMLIGSIIALIFFSGSLLTQNGI